MTDEGQSFKATVARIIRADRPDFAIPPKTPLAIDFAFHLGPDRLNKNDWDGLIKLLQDAIFETGGGNDAWIRQARVWKFRAVDTEPFSEVRLRTLNLNKPEKEEPDAR